MAEPRVIEDYLNHVARRLPGPVVAELADGLRETYESHRSRGLADDQAARATVAEFGDPATVIAAFVVANPARRSARSLLLTGPVVGGAWATVLVTRHAWDWPVATAARVGVGAVLLGAVGLLAVAALADRYRIATRCTAAACFGVICLDLTLLSYVATTGILAAPPVLFAATVSTTRLVLTLRTVPLLLASR